MVTTLRWFRRLLRSRVRPLRLQNNRYITTLILNWTHNTGKMSKQPRQWRTVTRRVEIDSKKNGNGNGNENGKHIVQGALCVRPVLAHPMILIITCIMMIGLACTRYQFEAKTIYYNFLEDTKDWIKVLQGRIPARKRLNSQFLEDGFPETDNGQICTI